MKRFIRKKLRRWLGIMYINNSAVHKDIFWTEIDIINNTIKGIYNSMKSLSDRIDDKINTLNDLINALDVALEHHTSRIAELDDRQERLEKAFYETIDEDVSAEVQWNLVKGNKDDK